MLRSLTRLAAQQHQCSSTSSSAVRRTKLVCPRQHVWFRPASDVVHNNNNSRSKSQQQQQQQLLHIELGLTQQGLDRLGDVTSIAAAASAAGAADPTQQQRIPSCRFQAGDVIASVHWEGFRITSADELYHTVWNNVEGCNPILAPVQGEQMQTADVDYTAVELEDNDVVASFVTTVEEWQGQSQLVSEEEYNELQQATRESTEFSRVEGLV